MSASLAAAKRRRAPGASGPPGGGPPAPQQTRTPAQPAQLNPNQAIMMLADKLGKLEVFARGNLNGVEEKFAEQDKFLMENLQNLPDVNQINTAFADLDARASSLESIVEELRKEIRGLKNSKEE